VQKLEGAILYEDDALLVLNKPSGLAVHGGSGLTFGAVEALRALRPQQKFLELVHRLDRDTSGCLLFAKKRSALRALHQQLREKTVAKRYLTLVKGSWPAQLSRVDYALKKNLLSSGERMVRVDPDGKPSLTRFKVKQALPGATLVEASPVTGRTHQIRVHTAAAGFPIAGDPKYGSNPFNQRMAGLGLNRLFLHAASITFKHPATEEKMTLEAPLPGDLDDICSNLAQSG
jgi:23S rRNA pseudouridine955/2504/2580 synthase